MPTIHLVRQLPSATRAAELAVTTQCSMDRLDGLERLVGAYDGVVVVAVLLEHCASEQQGGDAASPSSVDAMRRRVEQLHARTHARFEALLFERRGAAASYPINELRNASLRAAARLAPLVWIVDVDCVPSEGARAALVGSAARAAALRRLCCDEGAALVVPCVEMAEGAELPAALSVGAVRSALRRGVAQPFMATRWAAGHRATDFDAWCAPADDAPLFLGPLRYEALFEPYVIVAASLCPWFDAALRGYGRNKAAHALHLHRCGAAFWCARDVCLRHVGHAPSRDFARAVGGAAAPPTPEGRAHLAAMRRRFAALDAALAARCDAAVPPAGDGAPHAVPPPLLRPAAARGGFCCPWHEQMPPAASAALRTASPAQLTQLCSRWMDYRAPRVHAAAVAAPPPAGRGGVVWLVTHLSADRLDRLDAQLRAWAGPCAAAVWVGAGRAAARAVRAFGARVVREGELRLVAVRGEAAAWRRRAPLAAAAPSVYPANAVRRAALGAAPADALVLVVDVDARPCVALGLALASREAAEHAEWAARVREIVRQARRAAAIPCGERGGLSPSACCSPPVTTAAPAAAAAASPSSFLQLPQHSHSGECRERRRFLVIPALELKPDEGCSQHGELLPLLSAVDPHAARAALTTTRLQAFHASSWPDGHARTGTEEWLSLARSRAADAADAAELQHVNGYEPYGIVDAAIVAAVGSFDARFIGWKHDRAEFFARLAAHATSPSGEQPNCRFDGFSVLRSPAAFLLDWSPHRPTAQREVSRVDPLYAAAMDGLFHRSLRVVQALFPVETPPLPRPSASEPDAPRPHLSQGQLPSLQALADHFGEPLVRPLRGVQGLPSVWSADDTWILRGSLPLENVNFAHPPAIAASAVIVGGVVAPDGVTAGAAAVLAEVVCGSLPTAEPTCSDSVLITLAGCTATPSSARLQGRPVSGVAIRALPRAIDDASAGIALSYKVRFDEHFEWGGKGVLPGVYCEAIGSSGLGLDGRFRWESGGALRFDAMLRGPRGRTWRARREVRVDRRSVQLVPGQWHRLQVVARTADAFVGAWCDGVCVYMAHGLDVSHVGGGASGVQLTVFRISDPPDGAAQVGLEDMRVHGVRGIDACAAAAAALAHASAAEAPPWQAVDELIRRDVTVLFAPKEWQSTGPRSLAHFLSHSPHPKRLVVALVPPLTRETEEELCRLASEAASGGMEVELWRERTPYRNAYDLRNELAARFAADTAYVLHLNNDVVGVESPYPERHWLRQLLLHAERRPEAWAVMPLILERSPNQPLHLHAWWDSVALVTQTGASPHPRLHAHFDAATCSMHPAALPAQLAERQALFLEDHCILARSACFPPAQPLFDPALCFRREFFDLAWGVRARGGDVSMAATSVVVYDRLTRLDDASQQQGACVLHAEDLPGFAARRHDEISMRSVRELERKWRLVYPVDDWHAAERDRTVGGLRLPSHDALLQDPVSRARLIIALLALVGYNRFQRGCGAAPECGTDVDMTVFDVVSALQQLPDAPLGSISFWRSKEPPVDSHAAASCELSPEESSLGMSVELTIPNRVAPWSTPQHPETEVPVRAATRLDSLLHLRGITTNVLQRLQPLATLIVGDDAFVWVRSLGSAAEMDQVRLLGASLANAVHGTFAGMARSVNLALPVSVWQYLPFNLENLETVAMELLDEKRPIVPPGNPLDKYSWRSGMQRKLQLWSRPTQKRVPPGNPLDKYSWRSEMQRKLQLWPRPTQKLF
ncbi:hypothetical protein AB1Y20_001170 [Prymnesium parvum]|uniref:Uncharacterized protein n=1 Tax=Prymnesium parvum TaxID=97485 RepID=A0AB34K7Z1_PRYPA